MAEGEFEPRSDSQKSVIFLLLEGVVLGSLDPLVKMVKVMKKPG